MSDDKGKPELPPDGSMLRVNPVKLWTHRPCQGPPTQNIGPSGKGRRNA